MFGILCICGGFAEVLALFSVLIGYIFKKIRNVKKNQ